MADRSSEEPGPGDGGVFGKLPSARPGVRSSRRGEPAGEQGRSAGTSAAPQDASERSTQPRTGATERSSAPPPPTPPETTREPEAPERPDAGEQPDAPGVEDLAWAGITVAAEAATLGLRLLNRAVGAVRRPPERP